MIKEHVNQKEIKEAVSEVYQSLEYIEEYGHVGCFDITKEEVKKHSDQTLKKIKECNELLQKICDGIRESYEY